MTKEYTINGMKCGGCVEIVTDKFKAVPGVESVNVDLDSKKASVSGDYNEADLAKSLSDTSLTIEK